MSWLLFWNQHGKSIQISTNMPGICWVIREIALFCWMKPMAAYGCHGGYTTVISYLPLFVATHQPLPHCYSVLRNVAPLIRCYPPYRHGFAERFAVPSKTSSKFHRSWTRILEESVTMVIQIDISFVKEDVICKSEIYVARQLKSFQNLDFVTSESVDPNPRENILTSHSLNMLKVNPAVRKSH